MIYRELKTYETPLGLKKASRADLCERVICGHIIYKIDLLPNIFGHMALITGVRGRTAAAEGSRPDAHENTPELDINYPHIRESIITALSGDCSDEQYTAALTRVYENSPFFEAYINYHYIMRRDVINLKDLVIPLVGCVITARNSLLETAGGVYMAEDNGYLYIMDAYRPALACHSYVEIR